MYTDVLIVGAGPCGLAVAARLSESTPSALFTDDEHARYWKRFQRKETLQSEMTRKRKQSKSSTGSDSGYESDTASSPKIERPSMVVLDASSDCWLGAWKSRFEKFNIQHLRSPLFFHPDPRDKDGLLAYAYEQGRESELTEIRNVAGKEYSKHERKKQRSRQPKVERHLRVDGRDRIDYFTPSTRLFGDYCESIVHRYGLTGVVQKATVQSIKYDDVGCSSKGCMFTVDTTNGTYLAKIVVIATGPSATPRLPVDHGLTITNISQRAATHVFTPDGLDMTPSLATKIVSGKPSNVIVVGGGLTSAQVATELIASGVHHVWLLLRGKYKLKHFDVDLEWVSKVRNQRMAEFWSAETDDERAAMFQQARNGGSIPPAFDRKLQRLVKAGKLTICTHTRIASGVHQNGAWHITTQPAIEDLPVIDHVFFATGVRPDFDGISFLRELRAEHPMSITGGLPIINDDLMYEDDVPLFFTGALAALRLGPGAANLAGARQGAERIAWKVEELLGSADVEGIGSCKHASGLPQAEPGDGERDRQVKDRSEFTGGFANQFAALELNSND